VIPFLLAAVAITQAPDTLTLERALARARELRPAIAAAAAGVVRARGAAQLLRQIPNPSAQFEKDNSAPVNKVTIAQSFAWLPRNASDRAAGRAGVEKARADSVRLIAETGRDVRRAFYVALASENDLAYATTISALADSLAGVASRRAAAGDISDLERDQVKLEASRATLAAAQAREVARIARAELARAVAWESATPPFAAGPLDEGLDDPAGLGQSVRVAELPLVRAAVADSTAAAARLRSARIARVPFPGLVIGREWGGTVDGRHNAIIGASMPIPLWSWGGEAVTQARGAAMEQAAFAAETRLAATAQLDAAHARLEESTKRAQVARDSLLPEARRIRAGAVRLYEAGRTSLLPVRDALRAERDVARTAVAELLAFQEARADLYALLGRWP